MVTDNLQNDDFFQSIPCSIEDGKIIVPAITIYEDGHIEAEDEWPEIVE
jgi:hypothetical protein